MQDLVDEPPTNGPIGENFDAIFKAPIYQLCVGEPDIGFDLVTEWFYAAVTEDIEDGGYWEVGETNIFTLTVINELFHCSPDIAHAITVSKVAAELLVHYTVSWIRLMYRPMHKYLVEIVQAHIA